ncbi:MAG: hypothetical protein O2950_04645 [Proteobacteria bacterium]|nr:hypothetical protein [Pseudomonadota bacterium]MDA1351561.1 hypothetical protein [Pseudomonadota bacterium]
MRDYKVIADEDLEPESDEKTSTAYFLRYEFLTAQVTALRQRATLSIRIDTLSIKPNVMVILDTIRSALLDDFDSISR